VAVGNLAEIQPQRVTMEKGLRDGLLRIVPDAQRHLGRIGPVRFDVDGLARQLLAAFGKKVDGETPLRNARCGVKARPPIRPVAGDSGNATLLRSSVQLVSFTVATTWNGERLVRPPAEWARSGVLKILPRKAMTAAAAAHTSSTSATVAKGNRPAADRVVTLV